MVRLSVSFTCRAEKDASAWSKAKLTSLLGDLSFERDEGRVCSMCVWVWVCVEREREMEGC